MKVGDNMKNSQKAFMRKALTVFLAAVFQSAPALAEGYKEAQRPAAERIEEYVRDIQEDVMTRKRILVIGAKYGPWGAFDVGDIHLSLGLTESGEIALFSVNGEVGAFGFNQTVEDSMTLEELLVKPLAVSPGDEGDPVLSLSVASDFGVYGGELYFEYVAGGKREKKSFILSQRMGEYAMYLGEVANGNRLKRMQLYLKGTSEETLGLKEIEFITD